MCLIVMKFCPYPERQIGSKEDTTQAICIRNKIRYQYFPGAPKIKKLIVSSQNTKSNNENSP